MLARRELLGMIVWQRRKSIRPCISLHVAYEVGAARQQTVRSPRTQQRSCADAIGQCFKTLARPHPQWILEGDIKSCFDRISHDWLLAHVPNGEKTRPGYCPEQQLFARRPSMISQARRSFVRGDSR